MIAQKHKMLDRARKRISVMAVILYLVVFVVNSYAEVDKAKSGQADKIFDKAFLQSIKNVLLYEQIVKIVGVPPVKAAEASLKVPGEKYHWNGRKNSSFNMRVISGKVIDANVVTPDGRIISLDISLDGNGVVNDLKK